MFCTHQSDGWWRFFHVHIRISDPCRLQSQKGYKQTLPSISKRQQTNLKTLSLRTLENLILPLEPVQESKK